MKFSRTILVGLALTLAASFAVSDALAAASLDEANAKVITVSTRSGTTHQRLTLPLDKVSFIIL